MIKIEMTKNNKILSKNNAVQYDDFGDTFGKSRQNLHWEEIDQILSDFLSDFKSSTGVLADIGCGNGRLIKHMLNHKKSDFIQQYFSTYVGLDMSRILLNQARVDRSLCDFFTLTEWIQ